MKSYRQFGHTTKHGFTVLELIIGLGALAILFFVFISFFNPDEFLKESRDQKRIADLDALREALTRYVDLGTGTISLGTAGVVYGSNDANITGTGGEQINVRFASKNPSLTNGLGWIPANLDLVQTKKFSDLPRDPRDIDDYVYTFTPDERGGYKLTAALESKKYKNLMTQDCGQNPDRYEVGSDCSLQP